MAETISGEELIIKYGKGRLSPRPEYYSGRGATLSDLNSDMLEMVYEGVKAEAGDEAAKQFVQLVADFDKLSATAFLNDFYGFWYRGCVHVSRKHSTMDELDVGPDDGHREVVGMGAMLSAMSGMIDCDETSSIRGPFLQKHRGEYKRSEKEERYEYNNFGPFGMSRGVRDGW